jgi:RNA polymerase sigma-70 factor (ECF subfamily)
VTPSDAELIDAVRRGDARAFETLYDRYQGWIVSLAGRITRDRDDALDVLQETFAYFHRKLPEFELRSQLKTFLYPVVKHLALSRKEARRRERPLERHAERPVNDPAPDETERLLAGLSDEHKEVVLMRFVDGMELAAIADALGVPLGTVKSRLHYAIEFLRANPRTA